MKYLVFLITLFMSLPAVAWDGTDATSGASVSIEAGNLVREGEDIDVVNTDTGETRTVTVDSVQQGAGSVSVDVTDPDSGDSTTLDMDSD